jgi:hypothetical protein
VSIRTAELAISGESGANAGSIKPKPSHFDAAVAQHRRRKSRLNDPAALSCGGREKRADDNTGNVKLPYPTDQIAERVAP